MVIELDKSGPCFFFFKKSHHHQHFFVIDGLVSDPLLLSAKWSVKLISTLLGDPWISAGVECVAGGQPFLYGIPANIRSTPRYYSGNLSR